MSNSFEIPLTVAHQAPLSVGFSRVGCHSLLQGIQGLNLGLLYWQVDSLLLTHQGSSLLLYPRTEIIICQTCRPLVVQERADRNVRVPWPGCCKPELGGISRSHSESPSQQSACEQRAPSSMGRSKSQMGRRHGPRSFQKSFYIEIKSQKTDVFS